MLAPIPASPKLPPSPRLWRTSRRAGSHLLASVLLLLPSLSFAYDFAGGTGEPNDPYQIATTEDLISIVDLPKLWDKHFVLARDLSLSDADMILSKPIALEFRGVFDGNHHVISGLRFSGQSDLGLFGHIVGNPYDPNDRGGVVKNLLLQDIDVAGHSNIGGLAACNDGMIENCSVQGTVVGAEYVGGLVGINRGLIVSCSTDVEVEGIKIVGGLAGQNENTIVSGSSVGTVKGDNEDVGGLAGRSYVPWHCGVVCDEPVHPAVMHDIIGEHYPTATILHSFSNAHVEGGTRVGGLVGHSTESIVACYFKGDVVGLYDVGGLVGYASGEVSNSYARGSASGQTSVGGLVGNSPGRAISFCYAAVAVTGQEDPGGLVGSTFDNNAIWSFWDHQVSGVPESRAGHGLPTQTMMQPETYTAWHSQGLWRLDIDRDYPSLMWEGQPGIAFDEYEYFYGGGTGSPADPYQIWTAEHFAALAWCEVDFDKHFMLMADLDFDDVSTYLIKPIGTPISPFIGVFDGNGHTLANLEYHDIYGKGIGVFGIIGHSRDAVRYPFKTMPPDQHKNRQGHIAKLNIDNVQIQGKYWIGGLAGFLNQGSITHCSISGSVLGKARVGGLVGSNHGTIENCHANCEIESGYIGGGLVGVNTGAVVACFSEGRLLVERMHAGGLVGENGGHIRACYAAGLAVSKDYAGGLVGANNDHGQICFSYSTARVYGEDGTGGLAEENGGSCISSFWNLQTSGATHSACGVGKTSRELMDPQLFQLWGSDQVWTIQAGKSYPSLVWEDLPGQIIQSDPNRYGGGAGTREDPYQLWTAAQFVNVSVNPGDWSQHFVVMANLDLGQVPSAEHLPIGNSDLPFAGTFNGNGHTISGYHLVSDREDSVGVFGILRQWKGVSHAHDPEIRHLRVNSIQIKGHHNVGGLVGTNDGNIDSCIVHGTIKGSQYVGGFAGQGEGSIYRCSFDGQVLAETYVGGLVGKSENGNIAECQSSGEVTGQDDIGGLVGHMPNGNISRCSSSATVRGTEGTNIGGLVGRAWLECHLSDCHSSGEVSGVECVGGLVGVNNGDLSDCYSAGMVTGDRWVGGMVASNRGNISNCYSISTVTGTTDVGGLAGSNSGSICNCHSTGVVTGVEHVGGLVGYNWGGLVGFNQGGVFNCYSQAEVAGENTLGGLIGWNKGSLFKCYSTGLVRGAEDVGGLVGVSEDSARVIHCCWDTQRSQWHGSDGGIGLSTAEMMDPEFLGLNGFANDPSWLLDAHGDYPRLAWEGTQGELIPLPTVDWLSGEGTRASPFQIATADQLLLIGRTGILADRHFSLTDDLDLTERFWGQAVIPYFAGQIDGNGFCINGLHIEGASHLGLIGRLESNAAIKNLGLQNVLIKGKDYVGALVGSSKRSSVLNCHSTGTLTAEECVGGLVGQNAGGNISHCHSNGTVSGDLYAGGLIGHNLGGNVSHSHSTCMVNANRCVGGLVGWSNQMGWSKQWQWHSTQENGAITACYSTGQVSGHRDVGGLSGNNRSIISNAYSTGRIIGGYAVGGLVGNNAGGSISHSFCTGVVVGDGSLGGLVGYNNQGKTFRSFWDVETSDRLESKGGIGLTTAQMQDPHTYLNAGWDFAGESTNGTSDCWQITSEAYPRLLVYASTQPITLEGQGTTEQPYLIHNVRDLGTLWLKPEAHYQLDSSLDLAGITWSTAVIPYFDGTFSGNGHVITNLHIQGTSLLGLFGQIGPQAEVTDLGLEGVDINGIYCLGGLAGYNGGTISRCYSRGSRVGDTVSAGGLVGENRGRVSSCYSLGTVASGEYTVGGLVGLQKDGIISNCYTATVVIGEHHVDGLAAHKSGGEISNCFWNTESSDSIASAAGIGLTTAEMQTALPFLEAGWDFESVWMICEGKDYPRLQWEQVNCSEE